MSVKHSIYSYVNPDGELYIKTIGGKPSEFSDKYRVIKSIPIDQQRKVGMGIVPSLFPQQISNNPPFTNVFQSMEGSHFSEKEIPSKRTGIYWVKSSYMKKSQPNVMEPSSIIQMRNQVLNDGYPQNPNLIHNTKSQEFQLTKIKTQIEKT